MRDNLDELWPLGNPADPAFWRGAEEYGADPEELAREFAKLASTDSSMIPTTDGSRFTAMSAKMDPQSAAALRSAVIAAIAKASELTVEVAVLAAARKLDVIDETKHNIPAIENTALDAFADALAASAPSGVDVGAAIAAGAIGAAAAGVSIGKVRGEMYHAGSVLGDVEAVASGNPEKIVRRAGQHVFWRMFGNAGRSIFRKISGKR